LNGEKGCGGQKKSSVLNGDEGRKRIGARTGNLNITILDIPGPKGHGGGDAPSTCLRHTGNIHTLIGGGLSIGRRLKGLGALLVKK